MQYLVYMKSLLVLLLLTIEVSFGDADPPAPAPAPDHVPQRADPEGPPMTPQTSVNLYSVPSKLIQIGTFGSWNEYFVVLFLLSIMLTVISCIACVCCYKKGYSKLNKIDLDTDLSVNDGELEVLYI